MQNLRKKLKCEFLYKDLMYMGKWSGCHQMPERSFFINGFQFPVCARCTGIVVGYLAGMFLLLLKIYIPTEFCLCFAMVMFLDWYIQHINILQSTNKRRFITGTICGIGYLQVLVRICCAFVKWIF